MTKESVLRYLEYVKWLENEKKKEEEMRERTLSQVAADVMEANETKERLLREASQALEVEVRQAQLKQIKQRGRVICSPTL